MTVLVFDNCPPFMYELRRKEGDWSVKNCSVSQFKLLSVQFVAAARHICCFSCIYLKKKLAHCQHIGTVFSVLELLLRGQNKYLLQMTFNRPVISLIVLCNLIHLFTLELEKNCEILMFVRQPCLSVSLFTLVDTRTDINTRYQV